MHWRDHYYVARMVSSLYPTYVELCATNFIFIIAKKQKGYVHLFFFLSCFVRAVAY